MTKPRSLLASFNLLNLFLIAFIAVMASYAVSPLVNIKPTGTRPSALKPVTREESPVEHLLSLADYAIIADANLFHPDRKIPPEKKIEEAAPLPRPDLVLYGTVITGETRLAYLEDLKAPRSTPGRGKRQLSLREGDILSGFTLKQVEANKIVMVRGDEQMTVYVHDTTRRKLSGSPDSQAAQQPPPKVSSPLSQLPASEPALWSAPIKQKDERILNMLDSIRKKK